MNYEANSPEEYIGLLPADRKEAVIRLRNVIRENLPSGFAEEMSYGMIGYVVPHSIYPPGYHVNPKLPLPFLSIGSQKNYIALYHLGMYASPEILEWFRTEYPLRSGTKLDMGKSCIRFKNLEQIPYDLIAELCRKMSVADFISQYEMQLNAAK